MNNKNGRIKVSIIDDSKSYRNSLRNMLEVDQRICICDEYDSGTAFINTLDSNFHPDVCLIDVVLKDMSGIECAKKVIEKDLNIHIVIMTACPNTESFSEARKIGADYIEKGPRFEAIIEHIITTRCGSLNNNIRNFNQYKKS